MNYADPVTIFISVTSKEKLLLNNELHSLFMVLFTLWVMRKAGGDIRTWLPSCISTSLTDRIYDCIFPEKKSECNLICCSCPKLTFSQEVFKLTCNYFNVKTLSIQPAKTLAPWIQHSNIGFWTNILSGFAFIVRAFICVESFNPNIRELSNILCDPCLTPACLFIHVL